jgi:hypothetical protein
MACPVPPGGHAQHLYERNVRPGYRKARDCRTHHHGSEGSHPVAQILTGSNFLRRAYLFPEPTNTQQFFRAQGKRSFVPSITSSPRRLCQPFFLASGVSHFSSSSS